MLSPSKNLLHEYKTLILKVDSGSVEIAKINREFLCNAKTLQGLSCVLPILELV
jgi:hypothetical protein